MTETMYKTRVVEESIYWVKLIDSFIDDLIEDDTKFVVIQGNFYDAAIWAHRIYKNDSIEIALNMYPDMKEKLEQFNKIWIEEIGPKTPNCITERHHPGQCDCI